MLNKVYDVMTAVIGILNKQAVALAADSAVTVTNNNGDRKIFNQANKLFTLSKYEPVGVMIYNNANFMGVPWETIIKVYRDKLGDKTFDSLEFYANDFFSFLRNFNYFNQNGIQKSYLSAIINSTISSLFNDILKKNNIDEFNYKLEVFLVEHNQGISNNNNYKHPDDFNNYTINDFRRYIGEEFLSALEANENRFNTKVDINNKELLFIAIYKHCILMEFSHINRKNLVFTGLIFAGYGREEIFPSIHSYIVENIFDQRLRFFKNDIVSSINDRYQSLIQPFAQTDVITTILTGIDNNLDNAYYNYFKTSLNKIKEQLNVNFDQSLDITIDEITGQYIKYLETIRQQQYITPLYAAVAHLSKEDLADMAESMIHLTYLKRRVTNAEESVGGPVDVAVISKGDGFIWIKRKHYFTQELNQHFFTNYFKG